MRGLDLAMRSHVKRVCLQCGSRFSAVVAEVNRGKGKLCSPACRHSYNACLARRTERIAGRFWSRVDKSGPVHPLLKTRCWEWTGSVTVWGYGQINIGKRQYRAPRLAWFLHHGSWPDEWVLHRCDNRRCVRIDHLFEGNRRDNDLDKIQKMRHSHGDAHPFAKLNSELVRELRLAHSSGKSCHAMSRELGVSPTTVHKVITGKSWKHVR